MDSEFLIRMEVKSIEDCGEMDCLMEEESWKGTDGCIKASLKVG